MITQSELRSSHRLIMKREMKPFETRLTEQAASTRESRFEVLCLSTCSVAAPHSVSLSVTMTDCICVPVSAVWYSLSHSIDWKQNNNYWTWQHDWWQLLHSRLPYHKGQVSGTFLSWSTEEHSFSQRPVHPCFARATYPRHGLFHQARAEGTSEKPCNI